MRERRARAGLLFGVLLLGAGGALAHPLAPSLLVVREEAPGDLGIRWKTPLRAAPGAVPTPVLPEDCVATTRPTWAREGSGLVARFRAACASPSLVGSELGVDGLEASRTEALLDVGLSDGRSFRTVLRADAPRFVVPERESALQVAHGYGALGLRHILGGLDHLAFVFGLVVLVGIGAPLFWTLTAFTLGHSVTLSLAALGFVAFPVRPIELAIAASLVALGVELVRREDAPVRARTLAPFGAALFGLLHGLGFAGALAEIGLPTGSIPTALLSFNLGVEAGQLAFVGALLALHALLTPVLARLPSAARRVPAYAVGSSGAFWLFDRLLGS